MVENSKLNFNLDRVSTSASYNNDWFLSPRKLKPSVQCDCFVGLGLETQLFVQIRAYFNFVKISDFSDFEIPNVFSFYMFDFLQTLLETDPLCLTDASALVRCLFFVIVVTS